MNTPKYYYRIQELLHKMPHDQAKATIKLLEKELGKARVTKQRYYKTDAKIPTNMKIEESFIYKEIFELESTELLLSSYISKYSPSKFFEKVGISKR